MAKRLFDVLFSALVLALLGVPFLVIGALIKASSEGPMFYRSWRIGRHGRAFAMYKFRTMRVSNAGSSVTADGDRRITLVGAMLRRWKIDELPQLWNVFHGEMSIIGPRPEVETFVRLYSPAQREILNATPGFASMAQLVYPHEADLLGGQKDPEAFYVREFLPRKLALDLEYERRRTLLTDLWLIVQLALMILGRRVYLDLTPLNMSVGETTATARPTQHPEGIMGHQQGRRRPARTQS